MPRETEEKRRIREQREEAQRIAQVQQDEAQRRAREDEQARQANKEKALYALEQPAKPITKPGEEKQPQAEEDESPILKAYKEKYGDPKTDEQGRPLLSFPSDEEATAFFKDMAQKEYSFLALKIEGGKLTGDIKLSFGQGELIERKIAPEKIQEFMKKYADYMNAGDDVKEYRKNILLAMLEPEKNSAQTFRTALQEKRPADEIELDETPSPTRSNGRRT